MTKKHFIAIAAKLREQIYVAESDIEACAIEDTVRSLCDVFAGFNPAFDRARFLAACGVEDGA